MIDPKDMEELAAQVHQVYCAQYLLDNGKPYWTDGDYSKLDEKTKEYDRNIVRWHLKMLQKECPHFITPEGQAKCKACENK